MTQTITVGLYLLIAVAFYWFDRATAGSDHGRWKSALRAALWPFTIFAGALE